MLARCHHGWWWRMAGLFGIKSGLTKSLPHLRTPASSIASGRTRTAHQDTLCPEAETGCLTTNHPSRTANEDMTMAQLNGNKCAQCGTYFATAEGVVGWRCDDCKPPQPRRAQIVYGRNIGKSVMTQEIENQMIKDNPELVIGRLDRIEKPVRGTETERGNTHGSSRLS